ncbi:MAG: hypothetical protein AAF828_05410 [Bacteroidota bacterium]
MSLIRINSDYLKLWSQMDDAERTETLNDLMSNENWHVGTVCYEEEVNFIREYYEKGVEGFGGLKAFPVKVKVSNDEDEWAAGWIEVVISAKSQAVTYEDDGDYAIMRCPIAQRDTFVPGFSLLYEDENFITKIPEFESSILSSVTDIAAKIQGDGGGSENLA